jgi:putative salt-induced outer membrane protein
MKKLLLSLVLVPLCLLAAEETSSSPPPPPLWENNAEASLLLTTGNSEVTTVGLGLASIYRPNPWTARAKANFLTSRAAGVRTAESFELGLRGERKFWDDLAFFLSVLYLKNEFSGFRDRYGFEGGFSYPFIKDIAHSLSGELAFGAFQENLITGPGGSSLGGRVIATTRVGLEYKWKFSKTAELANVFSFIDDLKNTADWRLSNAISVTASLTDLFSLKVGFKVDYLHQPVSGKRSTDTATTVALVAKF